MGLGFAAFGAELPELEARCHERLECAQPSVLAATEDPQGTRVLNLFARDWAASEQRQRVQKSQIQGCRAPVYPTATMPPPTRDRFLPQGRGHHGLVVCSWHSLAL